MKKFMCVLISFVILVGSVVCIPVSAASVGEENVAFDSPEAMAEYIQSNLKDFTDEYNQETQSATSYVRASIGTEIFNPDYCEKQFSVRLMDSSDYVICMDFNDSNGYMIVSEDSIIKIETSGDLGYLYEYEGEFYFSLIDDDFVYCEDNEYYLFGEEDDEVITPVSYAGAQTNGVITAKYTYLSDRYGSTELDDCDYLTTQYISRVTQDACSVYSNGYTEGNCALVGIFNFLSFMKNKGTYSSLPSVTSTSTVVPQNDYFYQAAIDNGYNPYHTTVPALYYQIRQLAISSYGYTVTNGKQPNGTSNSTGVNSSTTVDFIETIGSYYNTDINVNKKSTTMSNIVSQIAADKPVLWYTVDDSVYGDHGVVITGYSVHKQYKTILGVKVCTNTINMLELANGWNGSAVYYDLESTSGKIFVFN